MSFKNFYQFENRFVITATLRMETPLSVGSRISLLPAGSDLPVMKTPEGVPFIPGSSLKGAVRTYVEQLLRTMEALGQTYNREKLWACDPLEERNRCVISSCRDEKCSREKCEQCSPKEPCGCPDCERCKTCMVNRHGREGYLDDEAFTAELVEKSCIACRLFGSLWLASRVCFQDALLTNSENLPRLTEVRDGVGIDRDLGAAKRGFKFDFEVVPAGATFGIHIVVENAEEWEVGLLLLALKAMERGELPIGGKTSRGLGWGKLENVEVRQVTKGKMLDWLQGKEAEEVSVALPISAFTNGLGKGGS